MRAMQVKRIKLDPALTISPSVGAMFLSFLQESAVGVETVCPARPFQ